MEKTDIKNSCELLNRIQVELKAPKTQENAFSHYFYRSCEDILESLKPLAAKYGFAVLLNDEIVQIGERFYVKAVAKLISEFGEISACAYAREALNKKGNDEAQITGAASSYARKYALNGLFAIDDNKDADYADNRQIGAVNSANKNAQNKKMSADQFAEINSLIEMTNTDVKKIASFYGVTDIADISYDKLKKQLIGKLNAINSQKQQYA